jgi:Leucine-rich repeat (LRR) protein
MTHFLKSYFIYAIILLDWVWGDCEEGEVELWGECYNIEETTFLQLSWNGLTGEIPPEIGNLINLDGIDLHSNQFAGEIPSTIGNLTNLTYLNFSNNELTGSIPPEIWDMINLTYLSLSSNQLTGSIPPEIGNLTNLTYLRLNDNLLTGEIPESICDIYLNLSYFSISNNQLCPPYPSCIEEYVGYQDTSNCGQNNIEIVYQLDWNLVGLPVEVENPNYLTLFPDAIENTLFSFDGAYTPDSIMMEGEGYWLRFESAGNTTITGNTINELTISLNEGWNLISGISTPLNITDIQDTDGIIIAGTVYGFITEGYSSAEIIEPGKGYWIRANNPGSITLSDN